MVGLDDIRITKKIFKWDIAEHSVNNKSNFCAHVKQILCEMGKKESYHRVEQIDLNSVKLNILEREKTKWINEVVKFSKLDLSRKIKQSFGPEMYVKLNMDRYDKSLLSQFRYGILPLEIETGRYRGVERENRVCTLCNEGVIEDQIHFALRCPIYNDLRNDFYNICMERIPNWVNLTDIDRIATLFDHHPRMFGKYIKKIFLHRKSVLYN